MGGGFCGSRGLFKLFIFDILKLTRNICVYPITLRNLFPQFSETD